MKDSHSCPACGAAADYRLGELVCASCGHREQRISQNPRPRRPGVSQASQSQPFRAPSGDDPLVRGSNADSSPGQLWKLKGGRAARPSIGYRGNGPTAAEKGAFLTFFFVGSVLIRVALDTVLNLGPGSFLLGIGGAAFFTLLLAMLFNLDNESLKGLVMIFAFLFALFCCYLIWSTARSGEWFGALCALANLAISGWLFSILYRQSIYEGM